MLSRFYDAVTTNWPAAAWAAQALEDEQPADSDDEDEEEEEGELTMPASERASALQAITRFRQLCLAYSVLHDPARRRIYATCGFDGLKRAEAMQDENVFDLDARRVREHFFAGHDPMVREFLLLKTDDREVEQAAVEAVAKVEEAAEAEVKGRHGDGGAEGEEEEEEDDDDEEEGRRWWRAREKRVTHRTRRRRSC